MMKVGEGGRSSPETHITNASLADAHHPECTGGEHFKTYCPIPPQREWQHRAEAPTRSLATPLVGVCVACGGAIDPPLNGQGRPLKYCRGSVACRTKGKLAWKARRIAMGLDHGPRRIRKRCRRCGDLFETPYDFQVYCVQHKLDGRPRLPGLVGSAGLVRGSIPFQRYIEYYARVIRKGQPFTSADVRDWVIALRRVRLPTSILAISGTITRHHKTMGIVRVKRRTGGGDLTVWRKADAAAGV